MEKQRSFTRKKQHHRLLTFFSTSIFFLLAVGLHGQNTTSLQFSQENDFAMLEDSIFVINLLDLSPSDVEIVTRTFPNEVEFISSEKSDGFVRQNDGSTRKATTILYTLQFSNSGTYDLGSLPVQINGRPDNIDFPTVRVLPNPDMLLPELFLEQASTFYSLHEGTLELSAKYFKIVESIEVGLSEKALIEQKTRHVELPTQDFAFSDDATRLLTLSCIPFTDGQLILPEISVTFIAFDGDRHRISLQSTAITVLSQDDYTPDTYGDERKLLSTSEQRQETSAVIELEKKEALSKELAILRIKEKYSILPFEAKNQRKEVEKGENIENENEASFFWCIIAFFSSFVLIVGVFVLLQLQKRKAEPEKRNPFILCFMLGMLLLCVSIFYGRSLLNQYAVVYGSYIHTIPEYESSIVTAVHAGSRVEILRSVGDWYLVLQVDGRSGWILKDNCILIDKE